MGSPHEDSLVSGCHQRVGAECRTYPRGQGTTAARRASFAFTIASTALGQVADDEHWSGICLALSSAPRIQVRQAQRAVKKL
jgi:hypothetical protein